MGDPQNDPRPKPYWWVPTQMCKYWEQGTCQKGSECMFAHDPSELLGPSCPNAGKGKGTQRWQPYGGVQALAAQAYQDNYYGPQSYGKGNGKFMQDPTGMGQGGEEAA